MTQPPNITPAIKLKTALAGRRRLLVVNIDFSNASLVAFLAQKLADVIFIDCEQGDTSIESIPDLVRASHLSGTPVVVRIPNPDPSTIERYMFRGVDGIVVPRLDTSDEAARVVDSVAYCFGSRAAEKTIVVQIESATAVGNLDRILAVAGIDAFFIGPVDLSRSFGFAGDFASNEMQQRIADLIVRISRAGRSAGMLVKAETVDQYAAMGANFLYLHTMDFLLSGTAPFFAMQSPPT